MDLFDFLLQTGLITSALVVYLIFIRRQPTKSGYYNQPGWNYPLKLLFARYAVSQWKKRLGNSKKPDETPADVQGKKVEGLTIRACSTEGTTLLLGIRNIQKQLAEVTVYVKLADGTSYKFPENTPVVPWKDEGGCWSANGLKIQILEPELRMRILYSGLLIRVKDKVARHVQMNLLWTSSTNPVHHPQDWSNQMAAQALALEPWRDRNWLCLLNNWKEYSWTQWGSVQGRFKSFDPAGAIDASEYLRVRGVRERFSLQNGYSQIRRSATIIVTCSDGTAVQLRGLSLKYRLTQCITGCVRYPNYSVESITSTDLVLPEFCETSDRIPKIITISVGTKTRNLKLVIRIAAGEYRFFSGGYNQLETVYKTGVAEVDGMPGSGIVELNYECVDTSEPSKITLPRLKWLNEKEVDKVGYCLSFEDRAASCPNYVGGKSASLALLASIQEEKGYKVPPGFCLTIRALERHLEGNPDLKKAIHEIEAANENYEETVFKDKCSKVVELFEKIEIEAKVKKEILSHLENLKIKSMAENYGPKLRFAVRSSAVGEDSEVLSAAGQNETILGCVSDADVLKGVQKCWGSMFAFTSSHYRRQNGQHCLVGGGVVVQTLISPQAAGVLFTRHPDAGDPSRILITANYGLGESVVSSSVEPDTILVLRDLNDNLTISNINVGSKTQRTIVVEDGTRVEEVSETDRRTSCLTESQILRLAKIGMSQDMLWGSGRDIEWAVNESEIFLLQARPITSLERWSEEELLHELDTAIMADDELLTFANSGEVMPKPLTALSQDLVVRSLQKSMRKLMKANTLHINSMPITHLRTAIGMYNTMYNNVPEKLDVQLRMVEMAVHGHKVADAHIHSTAVRRNPPQRWKKIEEIFMLLKTFLISKWSIKDSIKRAKELYLDTLENNPTKLFEAITNLEKTITQLFNNHFVTTVESTASQFIAMSILLEGSLDFTIEQSNEICVLLNCGDVLSAEVPTALRKLCRNLEETGRYAEFRAQDPNNAMQWLRANLPHIYLEISNFLENHGHRAYMEFDLATKPWVLVPEELIKLLQSMRNIFEGNQVTKSDAEIIASLKTPKKDSTRKLLKWVLPLCRRSVRHRECTKANLILSIHKLRLGLIELGRLLVKQWYLPHHELIFHFRVNELRNYLKTRDPALLKKAMQRRQYYPQWCLLKFPELITGWPMPLEAKGPLITADDVKVNGTSVCAGEVVARACVAKDLSEIHNLQQGDILITHSTDIGWSPYFPLLVGIVTELGGLISHGAVIAREYGLPCIVAATNATEIFKTGDTVRLSGTSGVVERVQVTQLKNNHTNDE